MAQDEDVFSQADALMRRHRSFLARGSDSMSGDAPARADDTDIPLLTEVVELAETAAPAARPLRLQQALASEFELWLAEALPPHVQRLSDKIGAQLLADLGDEARASLLPRLLAALADQPDQA